MNLDEKSYLERIADALEVINGGASTRTIDITENGTIDVKNFAYANVNVGEPVVYIPEQTVTTQRYGRDIFYAVLNDVNIDLNNPPSTFTLKVDNDEYEMEKYDSSSVPISYRSSNYYIFYDASYAEGLWVISDSHAVNYATFTVYAEGTNVPATGDFSTADVTIVNTTEQAAQFALACISDDTNSDNFVLVEPDADVVVKAILYKGVCVCDLLSSGTVELNGSIHKDDNRIIITGDGTILAKTSGSDVV